MTAEEVLSTMELEEEAPDVCVIDAASRTISVPECYSKLGVESDERTKRVLFRCPAVVGDNVSLMEYSLRIIYRNANRESNGIYLVTDAAVNGDVIEFSWLLSRNVTAYKGKVDFIFCAVKADKETGEVINEWNTTLASATVLEGLEPDYEEIKEAREDIIQQLLAAVEEAYKAETKEYIEECVEKVIGESGGAGNKIIYIEYSEVDSGVCLAYADEACTRAMSGIELRDAYMTSRLVCVVGSGTYEELYFTANGMALSENNCMVVFSNADTSIIIIPSDNTESSS